MNISFFLNIPFLRSLLLLTLVIALSACKRAIPNPESIDPIYQDLVSSLGTVDKAVEAAQKDLLDIDKTLQDEPPGSLDRKLALKKRSTIIEQLEFAQQEREFLKIRIERRRLEDKRSYLSAFEKGEAWPNKEEVDAYRAHRRLKSAPREWSARVPRLSSRIPASNKD